jgi:hypothetical protein
MPAELHQLSVLFRQWAELHQPRMLFRQGLLIVAEWTAIPPLLLQTVAE